MTFVSFIRLGHDVIKNKIKVYKLRVKFGNVSGAIGTRFSGTWQRSGECHQCDETEHKFQHFVFSSISSSVDDTK